MTDCGSVNEEMEHYISTANHLVIEANHDEHLLLNGPYPTYLKQRILSPRGHQSNDTCGQLLVRNYHEGLRNVWLCHLSQENNDPIVAFETVRAHLEQIGVVPGKNIFLKILARTTAGKAYTLNEQILPQEELNPNEEN
jgi:phosphoribosyl 1,2-cyclic phosphodiesterase